MRRDRRSAWRDRKAVNAGRGASTMSNWRRAMPRSSAGTESSSRALPAKAFIASLAGLTGNFGYTAYCASKFGVRGLAEALRYELKLQGIAVSLCCPGEIMTPMVAQERRAMHPVSAAMKDFAGSSTLDKSVPALLRGIARREFEITDTPKAALTAWLSRHTPGLARAVGDGIARRAQARLSKGTP